jgi:hypothetical protein
MSTHLSLLILMVEASESPSSDIISPKILEDAKVVFDEEGGKDGNGGGSGGGGGGSGGVDGDCFLSSAFVPESSTFVFCS